MAQNALFAFLIVSGNDNTIICGLIAILAHFRAINPSMRGLACHWLKQGGLTDAEIANVVYPMPSGVSSKKGARTDDMKAARRQASTYLDAMRSALRDSAPIMPDEEPLISDAYRAILEKAANQVFKGGVP